MKQIAILTTLILAGLVIFTLKKKSKISYEGYEGDWDDDGFSEETLKHL